MAYKVFPFFFMVNKFVKKSHPSALFKAVSSDASTVPLTFFCLGR